jgi:hypothetical protein
LVLKESFEPYAVTEQILTEEPSEKILSGNIKQPKQDKFAHKTVKDIFLNPQGKNSPQDRAKIKSIIKFLEKHNKSITYDYNSWYRVALAVANTFTHDIGEEYFLRLCRLDGTKHDEIQSKNLLRYCYENYRGEILFKTLVYLAGEAGYNIEGGTEGG